jgi:hypothetical protein
MVSQEDLLKCNDIKELRKLAILYYKQNLQGSFVFREDIGKILFTLKGLKEFIGFSGNINKLITVALLKEIILTGYIKEYRELEHKRKDDIVGFYPIQTKITLNNKVSEIEILIANSRKGLLFYDLFIDRPKKNRSGGSHSNCEVATSLK